MVAIVLATKATIATTATINMKNLLTILALFVLAFSAMAQQDAQYTQFMFNKIVFNPAYAGSHEGACFSGIYRTQWVNLEGAPTSQNLSFHTAFFHKRVGFGINIHHDNIGPTNIWNYAMMYAYRTKIGKGDLSFGVQGQIRDYQVNWQEVTAVHSGDVLQGFRADSKLIPNFGFGVYYGHENFFAGVSMPHLLNNDLTFQFDGNIQNSDFSRERRHLFAMGGLILPVSDIIKLKPAFLVKYVANAPFDMDLHAGVIFYDRINVGATYRIGGFRGNAGESIDFVLQLLITEKLKLGLAYDYTLSDIRTFQSGTYELMLEYCLISKQRGTTNPRFF